MHERAPVSSWRACHQQTCTNQQCLSFRPGTGCFDEASDTLRLRSGLLERVKARALQRLFAVCVQYVQLQAVDLNAIFRQADQPGPRPDSGDYLRGVDEICLAIRNVTITPEGTVSANARELLAASLMFRCGQIDNSLLKCSLRSSLKEPLPNLCGIEQPKMLDP